MSPPNLGQVNEAEEERLRGEREHQRVTRLCQQAEARVQALQKTLRRAIGKSRPYFELKAQFSQILEVANGGGWAGRASAAVLLGSVLRTDKGKALLDQPVLSPAQSDPADVEGSDGRLVQGESAGQEAMGSEESEK